MIRIIEGDCRAALKTLADNSVHTCVTSPPYYGLRDYGTAQWDGGDAGCDHKHPLRMRSANSTLDQGADYAAMSFGNYRDICGKCGARRIDAQLGLEASPDEWIAEMVAVFREVRRVLRSDGTLWLNVGDSYNANQGSGCFDTNGDGGGKKRFTHTPKMNTGLAPKQLLMMPARLALALQADGWWLRSDIIWAKPNPMPESVTDRPTSAHEHVFLLSKSARYFYDADAVRDEAEYGRRNWSAGRNCRNVWTIATEAFPQSHYATMPTELAERCIKAGTSERGCCAKCGAPWVRQTERNVAFTSGSGRAGNVPAGKYLGAEQALSGSYDIRMGPSVSSTTTGWAPSCTCEAPTRPCTVLDPFAGAGTTCLVADRLQRHSIGIELNPAYCTMARNRIAQDAGMFAEVAD